MNSHRSFRISAIALVLLLFSSASFAAETRRLTLAEAVRLAVEQNRALKIAWLKLKESGRCSILSAKFWDGGHNCELPSED
jgi:hypothetical protein